MDIIDFEEEKKPEGERVGVLANKSEVVQISIAIGIVFVLMLLCNSNRANAFPIITIFLLK
ncbi:MAG: hypothetical protein R2728_01540 [Chitinophagales bacterium]